MEELFIYALVFGVLYTIYYLHIQFLGSMTIIEFIKVLFSDERIKPLKLFKAFFTHQPYKDKEVTILDVALCTIYGVVESILIGVVVTILLLIFVGDGDNGGVARKSYTYFSNNYDKTSSSNEYSNGAKAAMNHQYPTGTSNAYLNGYEQNLSYEQYNRYRNGENPFN